MIDTDSFSARLRERAVRLDSRELLVANFSGSGQESDLTDPPNCGGVGRIRHFTRTTSDGWPENSLPIDPASAFLGLAPTRPSGRRSSRMRLVTGGVGTATSPSTFYRPTRSGARG